MGNFALAFLIVLILLFFIGYLPLKMEEGNIKRGDIFKRMDYKNKNTDPFQNDNNEYSCFDFQDQCQHVKALNNQL